MVDFVGIEQRIAKLERQNRWLKVLMPMGLASLVVVVVSGAAVVADNQIVLRDTAGTTRVLASFNSNDQVSLVLNDRNGKNMIVMGESAGGRPMIIVRNGRGTDRGRFGLDDNGSPFLAILDANGQTTRIVN